MVDDAEEAGEHDLAHGKWLVRLGERPEPRRVAIMLRRVFAVGVDEDVDVRQLHRLPPAREAIQVVGFEQ